MVSSKLMLLILAVKYFIPPPVDVPCIYFLFIWAVLVVDWVAVRLLGLLEEEFVRICWCVEPLLKDWFRRLAEAFGFEEMACCWLRWCWLF